MIPRTLPRHHVMACGPASSSEGHPLEIGSSHSPTGASYHLAKVDKDRLVLAARLLPTSNLLPNRFLYEFGTVWRTLCNPLCLFPNRTSDMGRSPYTAFAHLPPPRLRGGIRHSVPLTALRHHTR